MSRKLILCVGVIGAFALLAAPVAAGGPPLVLTRPCYGVSLAQ